MTGRRRHVLRGIAQPILRGEPLLMRLCSAFVENLALLLRTLFVIGSLLLVQDLQQLFEKDAQPVVDAQLQQRAPKAGPKVSPTREPVLTEGVRHALQCTFEDYRNANFDKCVKGSSRVYQRPDADEDDTGHIFNAMPVLYAGVNIRSDLE